MTHAQRLQTLAIAGLLTALIGSGAVMAQADPAAGVAGLWYDDEGKGAIEIARCGEGVCGKIVWLKDTKAPNGQQLTDQNNPDTGKRKRPICGLQIIGEGKPAGRGGWDGGWIYDPEEGKSYSVELTPKADGKTLQVHGYLGMKALGETMTWKRAPANLERCKP